MYSYRKSMHTPLKHNSGHNCVWSRSIHLDSCALKVSSHDCVRSCIFKLCVQHCSCSYSHIPLYAMHYPDRIQNGEKKRKKRNTTLWKVSLLTTLITAPKRIHVFPIFILSYLFSLFCIYLGLELLSNCFSFYFNFISG